MKVLLLAKLRRVPERERAAVYERPESRYKLTIVGGVTERSNVPVLKTGVGETPPWVRIPPPPPRIAFNRFRTDQALRNQFEATRFSEEIARKHHNAALATAGGLHERTTADRTVCRMHAPEYKAAGLRKQSVDVLENPIQRRSVAISSATFMPNLRISERFRITPFSVKYIQSVAVKV